MDASYDVETKTLSVTVTGERSIIFCENAPRITIYLTENNIKARNQSGYGTEYIHNNALRAFNDPWGWGEEITWNEDNTFEYTYDFTIKDKWVSDNMEIIAFVSDYNADDASSCVIENSIMRPFTDFYFSSVEASLADDVRVRVEDNDIVVDGRYNELKVYSVNGFEMSHENLPAGVYIVKVSTEDNNYSIRKVVVR
ncbi:MAG: Omp28-related outer membrane protein [Muribaculaceae bacterium]|nr:Omp28-related outer membrane protein [Muribaculaceae bacterium]